MSGQPLVFYEKYHICLLLVVADEKGIAEKSIMRYNANFHWDFMFIIKVGLISSVGIEFFR